VSNGGRFLPGTTTATLAVPGNDSPFGEFSVVAGQSQILRTGTSGRFVRVALNRNLGLFGQVRLTFTAAYSDATGTISTAVIANSHQATVPADNASPTVFFLQWFSFFSV
jgi:hypothetical protein